MMADVGSDDTRLGPRKLVSRSEYIRLIEQALYRLGYDGIASQLESQSGIRMQPPEATQFQERLLAGQWEGALEILPKLLAGQGPGGQEVLQDARFLIRQQQYLEALEAGDTTTALHVLRTQLAPLASAQHVPRLHQLAGLLLCPPPPETATNPAAAASWTTWLGGGVSTRRTLLAQMQAALPPWLMIPEGRLEVLLEQALDTQISRCPFHNLVLASGAGPRGGVAPGTPGLPPPAISLLSDYQAGVESLPSRCVQVLEGHTDEVWHVSFSHSGALLASGSKDRTAIVWSVRAPPPALGGLLNPAPGSSGAQGGGGAPQLQLVTPLHTLPGHEAPVLFLSWSPDDTRLLSISDVTVRLWHPQSGTLQHTYTHHKEAVTCCAWLPDSRQFVTGSVDRTLALLDVDGREVSRWKRAYRVQDLAVTPGGGVLVIAASDKHIHILRLSDQREVTLAESCPITSIDLSVDGRFLLANLQSQAVHLWHLGQLDAAQPALTGSTATSVPSSGGPAAQLQALGGGQQQQQQPQQQQQGTGAPGGAALTPAPAAGAGDPMDKLSPSWVVEYRQPGSGTDQLGRYVVRSSFGGASGSFVVHGSETGQVYVYHRDTGGVLLQLEGHTATVNACAWPPGVPQVLASASDDRTIRMWLAESALAAGTRTSQLFGGPLGGSAGG